VDSEVLTERLQPLDRAGTLAAERTVPPAAERTLPLAIARTVPLGAEPTLPLAIARAVPLALVAASVLVVAWLLVAPDSPDLAAQVYRVRLFEHGGFSVWDDNWYAGHSLPGYSLLFPWLARMLGMRLVGALAVIASTWGFERLMSAVYGRGARWAAVCFALAAAGDLWIGRLTFALGVALAVLAVLALVRERPLLAGVLAALCAAASPVAGLMVGLAGATHMVAKRRLRAVVALTAPALAVVALLEALFPEGGWEPFAASSLIATLAVTGAYLYAMPRRERLLRIGGLLYVPVVLASLIHTPMGSNVERYGVLLAAPLLVAGASRSGWHGRGRPVVAVGAALGGMLVWTAWGPVRESEGVAGDPSTKMAYYAPLERFLARHGGPLVRVEVPFTHSHWEAALLAPRVSLARGWERQLDTKYDPLFFAGKLTASAYRGWLDREGVGYVALPDARLDTSAVQEGSLVRHGLPYLREVLHTTHWRVFAVRRPTPLASWPGRLVGLGHDSFELRFARPGVSLLRLRYTPYWRVLAGTACVAASREGWTLVSAPSAGAVNVGARFSVLRGLGFGGASRCGAGKV
jgi:hypothetical protein